VAGALTPRKQGWHGKANGFYEIIRMKVLITVCRSLILLTLTALPASGTTYYVAKHGSDTNSGLTLSDPFETISSAAAVMVAGDTCFIRG
jgi:hypothetical protein